MLFQLRRTFRRGIGGLLALTLVVNVLTLVQPIYMIQVYDRILASRSVETLVFISILAGAALLLLGFIDAVRSMILGRVAAAMDVAGGSGALSAAMNEPGAAMGDVQPLRDLTTVRNFIAGKGIIAYLDLPFAPMFIGLLLLIHPHLFWLTVWGCLLLLLLTAANQMATARPAAMAAEHAMSAMLAAQSFARGAESIAAMGMRNHVIGVWGRSEAQALAAQEHIGRVNAIFAGATRTVRLGLQIATLGYGGYLAVDGQITAGTIFAATLVAGRGLQPIDQVVSGWRGFVDAAAAWRRLRSTLERNSRSSRRTELPTPTGRIKIDQLTVAVGGAASGGASEPILKRVSADIAAGECVAVIGPSGAGKSTLARAIVGALEPRSGGILIDGADLRTWDRERYGRFVGYLAQEVDLLPGTVAQNIARFDPDASDAEIIEAARKAQAHELVVALTDGYDTVIGPMGRHLAGGERQRIGLARAFYGNPRILVLDEPNANLDAEGDLALEQALAGARTTGVTVIIVTQRRPIADKADKILVLRDGAVADFGPRAVVLARAAQSRQAAAVHPFAGATDVDRGTSAKLSVVGGIQPGSE